MLDVCFERRSSAVATVSTEGVGFGGGSRRPEPAVRGLVVLEGVMETTLECIINVNRCAQVCVYIYGSNNWHFLRLIILTCL